MEEAEIITAVQEGKEECFSELLAMYRRMIYKLIASCRTVFGDYLIPQDDLYQEASMALYDAVRTFQGGKGAKFCTYAYIIIRRRLYRKCREYTEIYGNEDISYDNTAHAYLYRASSSYVEDNPVSYLKEQRLFEKTYAYVSSFAEEDRNILDLRSKDLSYDEIAKRLKIDRKRVDNRLYQMKKRVRRFIDDYRENGV